MPPQPAEDLDFSLGMTVYDSDGNALGTIRGFDEDGFHVTLREGLEGLSIHHVKSDPSFGEAELMWRCLNCGEVGDLSDTLPDRCPNCGVGREELYYWTED